MNGLTKMDYLNEYIMFSRIGKKKSALKEAYFFKRMGYSMVFNLLASEWMARFRWKTKEKSIEPLLIEKTIFFDGGCAFSKKEGNEWRNFRIAATNNLSFYGKPKMCDLMSYSGRSYGSAAPVLREDDVAESLKDEAKCAIITGFEGLTSGVGIVSYYTRLLGDCMSSIRACVKNITGTQVITCPREMAADVERERRLAEAGVPYIIKTDIMDDARERINLLSTPGLSDELKTLLESYDKFHADFLNSIGVRANNEVNKKSGITPMEIVENRHNTDLVLSLEYESRQEGIEMCERIGLKGLEVDLENFDNKVQEYDDSGNIIQKGGENGKLVDVGTPSGTERGNI